jgi:hypothetical protein
MRIGSTLVALLAFLAFGYIEVRSQSTASFNGFDLVDKSGNISEPSDYRDKHQTLGTFTVLDPKGDQMHFTYASPGTAEYYCKNGKFTDGTVLVKEVFGTDRAQMTTGDAHWATTTKALVCVSQRAAAQPSCRGVFFEREQSTKGANHEMAYELNRRWAAPDGNC